MPLLTIHHKTVYRYAHPVAFGEHRIMLRPRDGHDLRVLSSSLDISPEPMQLRWIHDVFGNSVAIATFDERAQTLSFTSMATVEHNPAEEFALTADDPAYFYPFLYDDEEFPDLQQFVTPQWGLTVPYSYASPAPIVPPPSNSQFDTNPSGYIQQANEVLTASANLTDVQKMTAELFNNKIRSLGFAALFIAQSRGLTLDQFVHYDFLTNLAAFDGGIAIWANKYRYDAVRPFTAIHFLYGNTTVTAWGGPGKGRVTNLPGSEWTSYLPVADHPEYPSGSACFCAAHAQASRRFLGSDSFGWSVPAPQGSSVIEPGVTPASDIMIGPYATFTEFETDCGLSRFRGGVHFLSSLAAAQDICRPIGDLAYEFVQAHLNGTSK